MNRWMHHEDETVEAERRAEYEEGRLYCVFCGYVEENERHHRNLVDGKFTDRRDHQFICVPEAEDE